MPSHCRPSQRAPGITTNSQRSRLRWSRFSKKSRTYALGDYMSALLQGSELPEARKQAVAEKLHEYTGLPVAYLIKSNLRVSGGAFTKNAR
jgi:hypothetical protein